MLSSNVRLTLVCAFCRAKRLLAPVIFILAFGVASHAQALEYPAELWGDKDAYANLTAGQQAKAKLLSVPFKSASLEDSIRAFCASSPPTINRKPGVAYKTIIVMTRQKIPSVKDAGLFRVFQECPGRPLWPFELSLAENDNVYFYSYIANDVEKVLGLYAILKERTDAVARKSEENDRRLYVTKADSETLLSLSSDPGKLTASLSIVENMAQLGERVAAFCAARGGKQMFAYIDEGQDDPCPIREARENYSKLLYHLPAGKRLVVFFNLSWTSTKQVQELIGAPPLDSKTAILVLSRPADIEEFGLRVETVQFENIFDAYDTGASGLKKALRVLAVKDTSPFYPDFEPGHIIWGSSLDLSDDPQISPGIIDGWVIDVESFRRRVAFIKAQQLNIIGYFGLVVPKSGVDWKSAKMSDYEAATLETSSVGGSKAPSRLTSSERYQIKKDCLMYLMRKCP